MATTLMLAKHTALLSLLLPLALSSGARAGVPAPSGDVPAASSFQSSQRGQLDPDFLLLPALDLQWVNPPQSVRVGDTLTARISAADAAKLPARKLSKDLQIRLPPGTENATENGTENDTGNAKENATGNPAGGGAESGTQSGDLPFALSDRVSSAPDGSLVLSVTPIQPGELRLPPLALVDSSGKAVARTNPLSLSVASAISPKDPKPKQPDPPRPPVSLGIPVGTLIALAVLALVLLAGIAFWLIRWSRARRSLPKIEPPKPVQPEDEIALARLAQLERKGLIKAGQFKAHYFAVSEIIKHYVGDRYDFDAAESTTFEMISYLEENKGVSSIAMDTLRGMFDRLDRVKFTDYIPIPVEGTELVEEARKLVMTTRRPPPVVNLPGAEAGSHASR